MEKQYAEWSAYRPDSSKYHECPDGGWLLYYQEWRVPKGLTRLMVRYRERIDIPRGIESQSEHKCPTCGKSWVENKVYD